MPTMGKGPSWGWDSISFFALTAGLSFFPRGLEGFFMVLSPSYPARIDAEGVRFLVDPARQWCETPFIRRLKRRLTGFSNMPLSAGPTQQRRPDRPKDRPIRPKPVLACHISFG